MSKILPVIFRKGTDGGDVTAVFPTIAEDSTANTVRCYSHLGQHSTCSLNWVQDHSRSMRALPEDYAKLLAEIKGIYERKLSDDDIAYELKIYQKITPGIRGQLNVAAKDIRYREVIGKYKLPAPPPGVISEMHFRMLTQDWHLRNASGWFYCDGRSPKTWVPSKYGPTS